MSITTPRTITLNAVEARKQFGDILNRAYYAGETFIIERAGQPMRAIYLFDWQMRCADFYEMLKNQKRMRFAR
jgi:hypothetical protein